MARAVNVSISPELAAQFSRSTLSHVRREYPHGLAHVLDGPEEVRPSLLHPVFFGSYDWHSCVHGWWQLLRLARLTPELAPEIATLADEAFKPAAVAGELAYLRAHPSFERPYGWAWLLALHGEAARHEANWANALEPLARFVAELLRNYLPRLTYPVRAGTHTNTAFALTLAYEWAQDHDTALAESISEWTRDRFSSDRNGAHLEPSGEDFLSPTLTEAVLMSKVLPGVAFEHWFHAFLPEIPSNLFRPAQVSSRKDGRIGHLDGLNLSRAWCWRVLARKLSILDETLLSVAQLHLDASLPHLAEGYMGEHWLATFALLALTG